MDGFDFTSHEALLDYSGALTSQDPQSQSQSYPHFLPQQPHHWSTFTFEALQNEAAVMSQQQQQHQQQQQQQQSYSNSQQGTSGCDHQHAFHQLSHPSPMSQPQQHPSQTALIAPAQHASQIPQQQHGPQSRPTSSRANQAMGLPTAGLDLEYVNMLSGNWAFQLPATSTAQTQMGVSTAPELSMNAFSGPPSFGAPLQASPIDFIPVTNADAFINTSGIDAATFMTMAGPMDSMNALVFPLNDYATGMTFPVGLNSQALTQHALNQQAVESAGSSLSGGSPTGTTLEVQSLSDNEGSWSMVNFSSHHHRHSLDSFGTVSNPSQNLHIRTHSDSSSSDGPHSAGLSGSYEEIAPWPLSLSSPQDFHNASDYLESHYLQHAHGIPIPAQHSTPPQSLAVSPNAGPSTYRASVSAGSSSTSPSSSVSTSPPVRRRKSSPLEGKTTKSIISKKMSPPNVRKDSTSEKKVGRRRGPLRPDQRQQAHEIRKLRACLRCKFLKKTCDKGEPCGGCRPSHARLWQVPCTRMDIKDIAYFMKDWKVDYERHCTMSFSVSNIKGFSNMERTIYITHGYGHYLPINAREVFVRQDDCFGVDWIETENSIEPEEFEANTAQLSVGLEGVSSRLLSEYLDRHLDQNFEEFVDEYFEGTKFVTEILKTAFNYYQKEKTPSIRKALKLVLAYNLTTHITMIEGMSEDEDVSGKIEDPRSKWHGKTCAPVMINFQVKAALADMWRDLQRDILEELSALYSSVYSGDKLKNWPTIFMLAAILLAIWEEMQFDAHYRDPDDQAVNKFCEDMETTPVGVIVGLFQAISTKLPGLQDWDTRKHHHLLNSNEAICEALTEVKGHVNKYESYLRERQTAKFDREDFDCLSNKFLSRLVIRAN